MIYCPSCGKKILQQSDDGRIKIRTGIVIFEQGRNAIVVCPRCHGEVTIDVTPGETIRRMFAAMPIRLKVQAAAHYKNLLSVRRPD